jgi:hypothetical protein
MACVQQPKHDFILCPPHLVPVPTSTLRGLSLFLVAKATHYQFTNSGAQDGSPERGSCVEYRESQTLTVSEKSTALVLRIHYAPNHLKNQYEAVQYPLIKALKKR